MQPAPRFTFAHHSSVRATVAESRSVYRYVVVPVRLTMCVCCAPAPTNQRAPILYTHPTNICNVQSKSAKDQLLFHFRSHCFNAQFVVSHFIYYNFSSTINIFELFISLIYSIFVFKAALFFAYLVIIIIKFCRKLGRHSFFLVFQHISICVCRHTLSRYVNVLLYCYYVFFGVSLKEGVFMFSAW